MLTILAMNKHMKLGYKRLIQGILTSQEYFLHTNGMLAGLELTGINTDTQDQILSDLKYQYEHIPYSKGRSITDAEQEILNRL